MEHSEQLNEIATALAKAQGEFESPQKKAKAYNYKYADLAEIMDCVKDPLSSNGLSIINQMSGGEFPILSTTLLHSSGQWIKTDVPLYFKATDKINEMQALGSAITYARRYAISCILNLAADKESDDDGVAASPPKPAYRPNETFAAKSTTTWGARPVRQAEVGV